MWAEFCNAIKLDSSKPKENKRCPYYNFRRWDYTAGCIGLGMCIGFIVGYFYK